MATDTQSEPDTQLQSIDYYDYNDGHTDALALAPASMQWNEWSPTVPDADDDQMPNAGAGGTVPRESSFDPLSDAEKLQLAERANEIYRQQMRQQQEHIASLRSLIEDKDLIIQNLLLRFKRELKKDNDRQPFLVPDDQELDEEELRRKAEALAQRTILENYELREMLNEIRDENFGLRNEIYELQDKINMHVLRIHKLERAHQQEQGDGDVAESAQVPASQSNDDAPPHDLNSEDALTERIDHLTKEKNSMHKGLKHLRGKVAVYRYTKTGVATSKEQKMRLVYPELYESENNDIEDDDTNVDVPRDMQNIEDLFLSQMKTHAELQAAHSTIVQEVVKLRELKKNVDTVQNFFGCSIKSLIPFRLNDSAFAKYELIFLGYYRKYCSRKAAETQYRIKIPKDVTKLISFYYPLFCNLITNDLEAMAELSDTQKLQLAERANEIYRQQLKHMQDHLASMRKLIKDKDCIIYNLLLRYECGLKKDSNRTPGIARPESPDDEETKDNELQHKAEALAQRTILENFDLRNMVNDLRDENYALRNEIFELQDKLNQHIIQRAIQQRKAKATKRATDDQPNTDLIGKADDEIGKLIKQLERPNAFELLAHNEKHTLIQRIKYLEKNKQTICQLLQNLQHRVKISPHTISDMVTSDEQKMRMFYPELYDNDDGGTETITTDIPDQMKGIEKMFRSQMHKYVQAAQKVVQLRELKNKVDTIQSCFGCSFEALIPFQLTDNAFSKYELIFLGYYRRYCLPDLDKAPTIPKDVTKLISFYYPLFCPLK